MVIVLHLHHHHLVAARAQARTEDSTPSTGDGGRWWNAAWPGLTRGTNRKLPYRGVERNGLWWSHRCAAVNLQRLITLVLTGGVDGTWAIA